VRIGFIPAIALDCRSHLTHRCTPFLTLTIPLSHSHLTPSRPLQEADRRRREEKLERAKTAGVLELQPGDAALLMDKRSHTDILVTVVSVDRRPVPPMYVVRFEDGHQREVQVRAQTTRAI
jgi:hypothetical protein